jgi:hypothetical protein
MIEAEAVSETLGIYSILTRLMVREDFITDETENKAVRKLYVLFNEFLMPRFV